MAVSDQEVAAWLAANPLATDAQIAAAMDQYGVSPAQMARVTGIPLPDVLQRKTDAQKTSYVPGQRTLPGIEERVIDMGEGQRSEFFVKGTNIRVDEPTYTENWNAVPLTESSVAPRTMDNLIIYDEKLRGEHVYSPEGQYLGFVNAPRESGLGAFIKEAATETAPIWMAALTAGYAPQIGAAVAPGLSSAAQLGIGSGAIAGGGTLVTGGSVEDALKNALIAGGTAYGASSLFGPTETATMADRGDVLTDVARLQQQGLSTNQIADILEFSGYSPELIDKGLAAVTTQTARPSVPSIVETPTNMVITGTAPINIPAIVGGVTGGLLSNISAPSVTAPTKPAPSTAPNIEVVSKKPVDTSVIGGVVGGGLLTGDVTVPSVTAPTETVTNMPGAGENIEVVSDRPRQPPTIPYTPITETPVVPEITNITPIDIPEIVADNPNITLNDLLKIITTLTSIGAAGALGGGGGGGGNVPFVAPTQTMPVNTDDYYKAIQQYYNTYLPEMPRDVATPLQQWYSGTFKV